MKNHGKIILIILIIICTANPVFSQNKLEDLQTNMTLFTDSMAKSLPFNSTIGNNWSDVYIGQIIDKPPHFGVGISAGFTTIDFISIRHMLECFDIKLPFNDVESLNSMGLPLPGYTADVRVGGVKFPFDFGLKAGFLPQELLGKMSESVNFNFKYLLLGADIRYSILKENKTFPVKLSVGLGFNYLDGGINAALPEELSFSFTDPDDNGFTLNPVTAQAGLVWRTMNGELKAQVSFPFKFVTPYAGAGVSYAWSQAGYKVTASELTVNNGDDLSDDIKNLLLEEYKLTQVSGTGFETIKTFNGVSLRVFGGASVNLAYFRIDLTAMYEFMSGRFGATVGLRFQL
jgi:opacity protein-like surface antigen